MITLIRETEAQIHAVYEWHQLPTQVTPYSNLKTSVILNDLIEENLLMPASEVGSMLDTRLSEAEHKLELYLVLDTGKSRKLMQVLNLYKRFLGKYVYTIEELTALGNNADVLEFVEKLSKHELLLQDAFTLLNIYDTTNGEYLLEIAKSVSRLTKELSQTRVSTERLKSIYADLTDLEEESTLVCVSKYKEAAHYSLSKLHKEGRVSLSKNNLTYESLTVLGINPNYKLEEGS